MFKFASNIVHLALASLMLPTFASAGSCICLACAFDPKLENFRAVSESMAPTIDTGDCALMRHFDPVEDTIQRGDVIGFEPQPNQPIHVFRVIAQAGDTISLSSGQITLNGQPIHQVFQSRDEVVFPPNPPFPRCEEAARSGEVCTRSRIKETLPDGSSYEIFDTGLTRGDDMAEITVPPSHIFVMGDHRDNAFDSRFNRQMGGPGAVALGSVIGIFDDPWNVTLEVTASSFGFAVELLDIPKVIQSHPKPDLCLIAAKARFVRELWVEPNLDLAIAANGR